MKLTNLPILLKYFIFFNIYCLSIISCTETNKKDFNFFAQEFITEYAILFPDETPLSIDNAQLENVHIPTDSILLRVESFYTKNAAELKNYNSKDVSPAVQKDFAKIQNILKSVGLYLREYKTNPTYFNVLYGFQRILNSNYAPIEKRLQVIFNKLDKIPAFYEAAKSQLRTSPLHLINETTEKHLAVLDFFENSLPAYIKQHHHITPQYQTRLAAASLAIRDYVAFVESQKLR